MFDVYTGLRSFLLADAGIAALVGEDIYPVNPPQVPLTRYVTLQAFGGTPASILNGRPSLRLPRMQVDAYARERSGVDAFQEARTIGMAILARLEGYAGPLVDDSVSPTLTVHVGITIENEPRDLYETEVESGWYRHTMEYVVAHGVGT